jgi:hypothetical protein
MKKRDIVKGLINEKFAYKAQQRYFYAKCDDASNKEEREWCDRAKEFSDDTPNFKNLPEKVKKESTNPKMKKGELMEYINFKKSGGVKKILKKDIVKENRNRGPQIVDEMDNHDRRDVVRYLEYIRESGLLNMFGAHPLLNWTKKDMERWLYGQRQDIESIEYQIEELKDDYEDDNESEIESLEEQLRIINYLLNNKQKIRDIRDILIRTAMIRIQNRDGDMETRNVQRVFEKLAKESWVMWTTAIHGH